MLSTLAVLRRCSIVGYWRRCFSPGGEVRRTPPPLVGASRCDGGARLCYAMSSGGSGSSTCRDFVYLDLGWNDAAGAPRPAGNVISGVSLIDAQRAGTR